MSSLFKVSVMVAGLFAMQLATREAVAANWGHWRGEAGNGVSTDAQPPTEWSETKHVKWKVAIPGRASSSPVIWNNQVFVTTAAPSQQAGSRALRFDVMCFDRASGERIWSKTAVEAVPHEGTHSTNSYASASPCTDGQHVYAHFGSRGLFCFTLDGELVWQRDFGDMTTRSTFGEGSSPTLSGDTIIVPWDHEGPSALHVLHKLTGKTIWSVDRDEPSCWATPLVITHEGRQQIILNGQNYARAYDAQTGAEIWRCGGQTERPVASPVSGDGLVFVGSGFRGSFLGAFRPDATGNIEGKSSVVWSTSQDTPDIPSLLLSQGRLYYFKGKSGVISCVDAATGRPHYSAQRVGLGNIYASPVAAGGHVYLSDRNGTTVVMKDSPQLQIVATNSLGETIDATLAPVDRELFIRSERHLFCIAKNDT